MSSPIARTLGRHMMLSGVFLVLLAPVVPAQSVPELEAQVADLARQELEARAALDAWNATHRVPIVPDTLALGTLTLIGDVNDLAVLASGLAAAWDSLRRTLGSDTTLLAGMPLTVTRSTFEARVSAWRPPAVFWYLLSVVRDPPTQNEYRVVRQAFGFAVSPSWGMVANERVSLDPGDDEVTRILVGAAWGAIASRIPPDVTSWAGSFLPLNGMRGAPTVYRNVLTSTVRIGPACLGGDIRRCQDGLGLTAPASFEAWYDDEDLRRWVRDSDPQSFRFGLLTTAHRECVGGERPEACVRYLRGRFGNDVPPPFDIQSRRLALAVALEMGGDGAIGRLVQSEGTMAERLETTAGESVTAITNRWQSIVVEAAGSSVALSGTTAVSAIIWVMVLAAAGRRNAQWR